VENFSAVALIVLFALWCFVIVGGIGAIVVAPIAIYLRAKRAHSATWTTQHAARYGGAYRAITLSVSKRAAVPFIVTVGCIASLYMLLPAIALVYESFEGACAELERDHFMLALLLAQALALALAGAVMGVRMLRREPIGRAPIVVAAWEGAFAVALTCSASDAEDGAFRSSYAIAAAVHAVVFVAAALAHRRVTLRA